MYEVPNSQVMKSSYANDVTLPVTNSKIFIEILLSSYYLTSWNFKLNFELPTQSFKIYFSTVELLTRSWKIKIYASSY